MNDADTVPGNALLNWLLAQHELPGGPTPPASPLKDQTASGRVTTTLAAEGQINPPTIATPNAPAISFLFIACSLGRYLLFRSLPTFVKQMAAQAYRPPRSEHIVNWSIEVRR